MEKQRKELLKHVLAIVLICGVVSYITLKALAVKRGQDLVGKCFVIEEQLTAFGILDYDASTPSINGSFMITGYIFMWPFKEVVDQKTLEDQMIPVAKEFPCGKGEIEELRSLK